MYASRRCLFSLLSVRRTYNKTNKISTHSPCYVVSCRLDLCRLFLTHMSPPGPHADPPTGPSKCRNNQTCIVTSTPYVKFPKLHFPSPVCLYHYLILETPPIREKIELLSFHPQAFFFSPLPSPIRRRREKKNIRLL